MQFGSGAYEGAFTWASRFAEGDGTNPEELIGAAHAGCFSMFLSSKLTNAGFLPTSIETTATVHLGRDDSGPKITLIELNTEATVPGVDDATFLDLAEQSKAGCPVSRALAGTEITLEANIA
jgi:osmotically inducible protein OsmC